MKRLAINILKAFLLKTILKAIEPASGLLEGATLGGRGRKLLTKGFHD